MISFIQSCHEGLALATGPADHHLLLVVQQWRRRFSKALTCRYQQHCFQRSDQDFSAARGKHLNYDSNLPAPIEGSC